MTEQEMLNQRVERDVRTLIGDLHLQIIILRAQVEQQQSQQAVNGKDQTNAPRQSATT